MRLRIAKAWQGFITLSGFFITMVIVAVVIIIACYVAVTIIERARTIERNRQRQMETNAVEESWSPERDMPPDEQWVIAIPPDVTVEVNQDYSVDVTMNDGAASNIMRSVGVYYLAGSSNLPQWVDSDQTLVGDSNAVRGLCLDMLRGIAAQSDSRMFFIKMTRRK